MHVSLRVLAFLSPVLLAPAAAQQHIWSGPGWERPIEDGHLPEGLANGGPSKLAVAQVHGDLEPEALFLVGSDLLAARDFASRITYDRLASTCTDFAVWRSAFGARVVSCGPTGLAAHWGETVGERDVWTKAKLLNAPFEHVRSVRLAEGAGLAAWIGSDLTVLDHAGAVVRTTTLPGVIVDVACGELMSAGNTTLAVATKTSLLWFDLESGELQATWPFATNQAELGVAPGSWVGLDLLLVRDGGLLYTFNAGWTPAPIALGPNEVAGMQVADWYGQGEGREALLIVDRTMRGAWVLERLPHSEAAQQNVEYRLNADPAASWFVGLDGLPAGAALAAGVGDLDQDGDPDLLALTGSGATLEFAVRPGEAIDAEAMRPHPVGGLLQDLLGAPNAPMSFEFVALDTAGNYLPAGATHLELTAWHHGDGAYFGEDPVATALETATELATNQSGSVHAELSWTWSDQFAVRMRGVTLENGVVTRVFPSRTETFSFDNPMFWTVPNGWNTFPYVARTGTDPEGTGSVRGGGSGPTPPGSGG